MDKIIVMGGLCLLFLNGCTWVKLTPEGENVAVLDASSVEECARVREMTATVLSKVGVNRSAEKVALELQTMARNRAADFDGDVVVPTSEIVEGERSYTIYRCRP